MSLGLAEGTLDGDEPEFIAALERIRDAAKANSLPMMGFGLSPSTLKQRMEVGWNAFIVHGDVDAICVSADQTLREYTAAAQKVGIKQEKRRPRALKL